jgi:hypothetical protein
LRSLALLLVDRSRAGHLFPIVSGIRLTGTLHLDLLRFFVQGSVGGGDSLLEAVRKVVATTLPLFYDESQRALQREIRDVLEKAASGGRRT